MKKYLLLLIFGFLFCTLTVNAQDGTGMNDAASVNYVAGDLDKLDKMQLAQIYIAKINRLFAIMPYIPFQKLEPTGPNDIKIPSNSINEKAMERQKKETENLTRTNDETLANIIPYSDKTTLVNAILFVQSFINKIELIGLGMNKLGY